MDTKTIIESETDFLVEGSKWEHLSVELTSKCNLRCVYCGKSDEKYNAMPGHDEHMTDAVSNGIVDLAAQLGFREVNFNGTGEISIYPGWTDTINDFKQRSKSKLYVVTNFAKRMTEEELDAYLKLDRIYISVDTADRDLLKHIRTKVDIRMITDNIVRMRLKAILEDRKLPWLRLNCVVSDLSGPRLRELAAYAVAVKVNEIEMFPLNGNANTPEGNPKPLNTLGREQLHEIADQALQAKALMQANEIALRVTEELRGIFASVHEDWKNESEKNKPPIEQDSDEEIYTVVRTPKAGEETRLCLQPWRRLLAGADGRVYPCCRKAEVLGNLNTQSVTQIATDTPLRELRQALLDGNLQNTKCTACANAPIGSVDEMKQRVSELVKDS